MTCTSRVPLSVRAFDPFPQRLQSLLRSGDESRVAILQHRLEEIALERFRLLDDNDILFADSTHVSKIGSDVNRLVFEILPVLRPGVYVHFHDIFYPFEYPEPWVYEGRAWNEAYLLRAFLQFNRAFKIRLFNTFLAQFHGDLLAHKMPLCLRNPGGSLWIQRV